MSGNNILFIAPVFYDYQNLIIDKIRKNKDEVVFCNCNRNLEYLVAKYRKLKGGE